MSTMLKHEVNMSLISDPVFKIFFKSSKKYLEFIIREVTGLDIIPDSIEYIDTEMHGEYRDIKVSRFDLRVRLTSGEEVIVEMQARKKGDILGRVEYYASKAISDQLKESIFYDDLRKVYTIVFLGHNDKNFPNLFTKIVDYDILNLQEVNGYKFKYFINLTKLDESKDENKKLMNFLKFMTSKKLEEMEEMAKTHEELENAYETMKRINTDDETRLYIRQREKDDIEIHGWLKYQTRRAQEKGLEKGIKKGIEQGIKETKKEMVINLHKQNVSLDVISSATGLSIKEINDILESNE